MRGFFKGQGRHPLPVVFLSIILEHGLLFDRIGFQVLKPVQPVDIGQGCCGDDIRICPFTKRCDAVFLEADRYLSLGIGTFCQGGNGEPEQFGLGAGKLGDNVINRINGARAFGGPMGQTAVDIELDTGGWKHGIAGQHMDVFQAEDFRGPKDPFIDQGFNIFVLDALFLVGQVLEFFEYHIQFIIGQIIAHGLDMGV